MSKSKMYSMVFNGAGVLVVATVVGHIAYSSVVGETIAPCSKRYPAGQRFSLEGRSGKPLTPIELQARLGLDEWGVMQNAIVKAADKTSPKPFMDVLLADTGHEDVAHQNGIGFAWNLPKLAAATSACLSYSVQIGDGVDFARAGYLPGLFGTNDKETLRSVEPQHGFSTRLGWLGAGVHGLEVRSPSADVGEKISTHGIEVGGVATTTFWLDAKGASWEKGRWSEIEQEVVLNTDGQQDGTLRVWIDGELRIASTGLRLRKHNDPGFTGVVSDIGYAPHMTPDSATEERTAAQASVQVTPFVVQWQ